MKFTRGGFMLYLVCGSREAAIQYIREAIITLEELASPIKRRFGNEENKVEFLESALAAFPQFKVIDSFPEFINIGGEICYFIPGSEKMPDFNRMALNLKSKGFGIRWFQVADFYEVKALSMSQMGLSSSLKEKENIPVEAKNANE